MRPTNFQRFADSGGSWLLDGGPEEDVVISCRTRLARNVEGYPFISKLGADDASELCERVRVLLEGMRIDGETLWFEIDECDTVVRLLLRERHLASRDLAPCGEAAAAAPSPPGRAVAFGESEQVSVMINEEDHLRLQGLAPGFDLAQAFRRVRDLDVALEDRLTFATTERLGYLTGCPTNVGTGMRASVMLHLPALGLVRSELEKVFAAAQRTGLAVRGMYGEGSRAAGDFYQISNQITLGRTEEQLIGDLDSLVPHIVAFERKLRKALLEEQRASVEDRVRRAQGHLSTARNLTTEEALQFLSHLRLGVCLGLLSGVTAAELSRVAILVQKGHVQALHQDPPAPDLLEMTARDRLRASWLRRRFASLGE